MLARHPRPDEGLRRCWIDSRAHEVPLLQRRVRGTRGPAPADRPVSPVRAGRQPRRRVGGDRRHARSGRGVGSGEGPTLAKASVAAGAADPLLGRTFAGGRYRIEAVLGVGGMGRVYRATQVALSRPVAVKILSPELASDEHFRRRFDREAGTLAALQHPHIVTVHDMGVEDGTPYIVMALVDGPKGVPVSPARPARRRADRGGPRAPRRAPDVLGARVRPCEGHRPPRHQAGEHPARRRGRREGRRLRDRERARARAGGRR